MRDREENSKNWVRRRFGKPSDNVTLEAQGHLVRVKHSFTHIAGGGSRGVIAGFSRASRKRMLETLARIDFERAGFVCFVTLTYPDRSGPPTPEETERDRPTFLKRIKRRFPESSALWRREWEDRKSGAFMGTPFPHYHLLFFNLPFVHYSEINRLWAEVIDFPDVRTEIKGIESWRRAMYYVSKYMAKATPRPTAATRKAAEGGGEADACSLVNGAYLTGERERKKKRRGRSWGVFNRRHLPFAREQRVIHHFGKWLKEAKELARSIYPGVDASSGYGFTLFDDDAPKLLKEIHLLAGGNDYDFDEHGAYDPVPF